MSDEITPKPEKVCKTCGLSKVREFLKYHASPQKGDSTKRRRKFVDETGNQWHGSKCPQCASSTRKTKYISESEKAKTELLKKLGE